MHISHSQVGNRLKRGIYDAAVLCCHSWKMQADPSILPLQLPPSSSSIPPCMPSTPCSSLVGSRSSSGLRGATSEAAAAESPPPGSSQLELLSLWRVPDSTQSWSLGSFTLTRMVQPRGIQSRATVPFAVAGDYACGRNALSALTGEALGSIRRVSVTFLRHLVTKMLGNTKRPAP